MNPVTHQVRVFSQVIQEIFLMIQTSWREAMLVGWMIVEMTAGGIFAFILSESPSVIRLLLALP